MNKNKSVHFSKSLVQTFELLQVKKAEKLNYTFNVKEKKNASFSDFKANEKYGKSSRRNEFGKHISMRCISEILGYKINFLLLFS